MEQITIKQLKNYFDNDLQMTCKHDLKACKYAFNVLNKEVKTNILDLVYLIFENKPIDNLYTHSYNFHTRNGRYIIDSFKNYYYNYLNKQQYETINKI